MTSTTSSVSPGRQILGVFRWQLRRSAGITAVYAAILLLSYPVLLLFTLSGRNNYYYEGMSEAQLYEITVNNVVISTRAATTILGISAMILFALIFTLAVSYTHLSAMWIPISSSIPTARSPPALPAGITCSGFSPPGSCR